jgi:hypothetical protein
MTAIVHGWNKPVEKSEETVLSLIALNKLLIPEVLIDIIKDYLYISAYEVLCKYYKYSINKNILYLRYDNTYILDSSGRRRIAHWSMGDYGMIPQVQLQNMFCITCGNPSDWHNNDNGCCIFYDEGEDEHNIQLLDSETDEVSIQEEDQSYSQPDERWESDDDFEDYDKEDWRVDDSNRF